jgi:hypothetical protein
MKKIFQAILNPGNQADESLFTQQEINFIDTFFAEARIFNFDGIKCTWKEEADSVMVIAFVDQDTIDKLTEIDLRTGGSPDTYTDITKDVINGTYDTKIFGFAEESMIVEFHRYKEDFIEIDDILDKINEVGIESLTDNDKRLLRGEERVSPLIDHFKIEK